MNAIKYVLIGTNLAFLGTIIGSAFVFFINKPSKKLESLCLGFAAGVMMSASIFSLLIPSMESSIKQSLNPLIPIILGITLGVLFVLILDKIIPHFHIADNREKGIKIKLQKAVLLVLTVTLHNIPEGMAVGVAFALAIGMFLQNLPEGIAIALPLKQAGKSRKKAFMLGSISGIVEPIFGVITVLLVGLVSKFLPYVLAFAAGAMIYVVVEELIPESQSNRNKNNIGVISFMIGFLVMMILDISLG
ncbi:MAG: ZIP family metal transporter [Bacilli bacterium]|nr:ZIP family metal transporter [Bacilli bacterium]